MATWKDIEDKITAETTLVGSVKVLVLELKQKLSEAGVPQAALDAAFAALEGNSAVLTELTAAVVENTPAADIPVDQPV